MKTKKYVNTITIIEAFNAMKEGVKMIKVLTMGSLLAVTLLVGQVHAQSIPTDPMGGKPPAGSIIEFDIYKIDS